MINRHCEVCDKELPAYRLPWEKDGTSYWQMKLSRDKAERSAKEYYYYQEVCDECVQAILVYIESLGLSGTLEEGEQSDPEVT